MTTKCNTEQLAFQGLGRREVVGRFDGGEISSDGGGLLLREVEQRTQILRRLSQCFTDRRDPARIEHALESLVKQRVLGIALGYEDLNDHDELCRDSVLALLSECSDMTGSGRVRLSDRGKPLAGKSTLNRLELTPAGEAGLKHRYKQVVADFVAMDALLVEVFLESYETAPEEIILDVDATDDPVHGHQAGRFFHGYYRHYCYLPLYIFCGEQLLCARLRTADQDGAAGTTEELACMIERIRARWPEVCQCRCKTPQLCRSKIPQFVDGGRSLRLAELHSTEDAVRLVSTDGGIGRDYLGETLHASRTSCTRRFHQRHCPTNGTGPEDGPASPGRGEPATGVQTESAARLVTGPVYCVSASPA